eukprot:gnl/Dysnectes_brevis/3328_a4179_913.p1 GENE.gnl/Dysnectes_brevis/3328_a4179_913~~gnl/Dysnectes_brevis/3328_a4179_913.p1  ORF type:complete len:304 (+),score=98.66 gnl/Dysnectes_brevis/3328_a4179_913:48-959(+)
MFRIALLLSVALFCSVSCKTWYSMDEVPLAPSSKLYTVSLLQAPLLGVPVVGFLNGYHSGICFEAQDPDGGPLDTLVLHYDNDDRYPFDLATYIAPTIVDHPDGTSTFYWNQTVKVMAMDHIAVAPELPTWSIFDKVATDVPGYLLNDIVKEFSPGYMKLNPTYNCFSIWDSWRNQEYETAAHCHDFSWRALQRVQAWGSSLLDVSVGRDYVSIYASEPPVQLFPENPEHYAQLVDFYRYFQLSFPAGDPVWADVLEVLLEALLVWDQDYVIVYGSSQYWKVTFDKPLPVAYHYPRDPVPGYD